MLREEVEGLPETMRPCPSREGQPKARALVHFPVWDIARAPRVTVGRRSSASTLFSIGRATFAAGCGLWLGARWRQAGWQAEMERALRLLADSGLGGGRSIGCGAFAWEHGEGVNWEAPAPGARYVTLSRYHPRRDETPEAFSGPGAAYTLHAVAGYLQTASAPAQRRRRLWMAAEGSVLCAVGDGPYGDVVDVRPQVGSFPHPVWRCGLACPVALEERRHA